MGVNNATALALRPGDIDDIYGDVEDDGFDASAHYTNTPVLGLATLEISCGDADTGGRRASRHHLVTVNSAGQNGANTLHGSSCSDQRQTDRTTSVWSSASPDVEVSGSSSDSRSVITDKRLRTETSAAYCGKSPQRMLKEIYAQMKVEQLRNSTAASGDEKMKTGCPAIIVPEAVPCTVREI